MLQIFKGSHTYNLKQQNCQMVIQHPLFDELIKAQNWTIFDLQILSNSRVSSHCTHS